MSAHTELRERPQPAAAPASEDAPTSESSRRSPWAWAVAVVVVALAGAALMILRPWAGTSPQSPSSVDNSPGPIGQDPGGLGDNLPAGVPTVTATRVDDQTVRFTWEYSNPRESDEFRWRSDDGREDVSPEPLLDLPVPAGSTVCVQVRVIRLDGGQASVDWSPEGCGG